MQKQYQQFFFDFDSTIVATETLDLLAKMKGIGPEVEKMTEASMNGEVRLEDVFAKKMDMIAPCRADIDQVILYCKRNLVEGIAETFHALQFLKKEVYIVTSNFYEIAGPVGQSLNIDKDHVISNFLYFDDQGEYTGISDDSMLCKSGGKANAIEPHLCEDKLAVFIGDAASDLATKGTADLFVGFGGVVARNIVRENADIFFDSENMVDLLRLVLDKTEIGYLNFNGFKNLYRYLNTTAFLCPTFGPGGTQCGTQKNHK
ncbi:MAG: HAD-IB family phosphatase [Patescibacteria group bacterium]